jgi:acyl carrier protein
VLCPDPKQQIDRNGLPAPLASGGTLGPSAYVAPRNDLEISLATVWQRLLGVDRVGTTDNFFELGGNSLLALKLTYEMEKSSGLEIDLGEIFRSPTIAELVTSLGPDASKNASVVVPLQSDNGIPVFGLLGINIYKPFAHSLATASRSRRRHEERAIAMQVIRGQAPDVSRKTG